MKKRGAYVLYLHVKTPLGLTIGSLGLVCFPAGRYAYVGSACGGVAARVARHRRLAENKSGKPHWHIDYLLVHPRTVWMDATMLGNGIECTVSKDIASAKGVTTPVPGFGSSDCRSGCKAHLYHLPPGSVGFPPKAAYFSQKQIFEARRAGSE
jgi:Uri superfamily endonuclease